MRMCFVVPLALVPLLLASCGGGGSGGGDGNPPTANAPPAFTSLQTARSWRVYATMVGLPLVPLEAWMRTTSARGTASRPSG